MATDGFHDRLKLILGTQSPRQLADVTGVNPERIRRIVSGAQPTTDFIVAVCSTLDISADWLLLGRGPVRATEVHAAAMSGVPTEDLIGTLSVLVRRRLEELHAIPHSSN